VDHEKLLFSTPSQRSVRWSTWQRWDVEMRDGAKFAPSEGMSTGIIHTSPNEYQP
jgi:hypothetical protein